MLEFWFVQYSLVAEDCVRGNLCIRVNMGNYAFGDGEVIQHCGGF